MVSAEQQNKKTRANGFQGFYTFPVMFKFGF